MSSHYKAVVADFDGTIVDGLHAWFDMYDAFEKSNGVVLTPEQKEKVYVGSVQSVAHNYLCTFPQLSHTFTQETLTNYFVDNSREATLNAKPISGAIEFIKTLHSHNIPFAIASSSTKGTINLFLEKHGILNCTNFIIVGSEMKRCKPYADIYIEASKRLGVDIKDTVVFEDSKLALQKAKEAGFMTVLIQSVAKGDSQCCDIAVDSFDDERVKSLFF
ncbi:2-deoxyglucose-6-phosphate phosphatase, putative [Entamoeba invadens IP1]|uniref:2-deoxyglucose-6-phosphate phosphatase, putative n=1 Tax=Entamoeba invadens IP1 TaxID=370355 RepID=A0A0A1TY40_ENTIV|nr:2-deoxyglucose-6-phosphate phosphatase, putative [Entamoeba invadens IP1]ELP83426.1 2-deoxyglucose-6-phosphate phosphatase, putative [Entamoeba invadens IP1]|eukprot:XP_004182772.1 2-deoxyglucose-6-phosphate phosphatase, putative [Entamoeba invadens IP1]